MKKIATILILFMALFLMSCDSNINSKKIIGDVHLGMSKDDFVTALQQVGAKEYDGTWEIKYVGYTWIIKDDFKDNKLSYFAFYYPDVLGEDDPKPFYQAIKGEFVKIFGEWDDKQLNENLTCGGKEVGDDGYVRVYLKKIPGFEIKAEVTNDPERVRKMLQNEVR